MQVITTLYTTLFIAAFAAYSPLTAQETKEKKNRPQREYVYQTFKDTRIINTQSVETLQANQMDVRISHRFGDMFGSGGGIQTFFGLENAADISMGVDYGITNNLMVGIHRAKGGGAYRQLLHGFGKYRILRQTADNKIPFSMSVVGIGSISIQKRDTSNALALAYYPKAAHRLAYGLELHIARKFGNVFALQLSPTFIWRNYVPMGDENALFSMGVAMKIQMSKLLGLILEGNFPLSKSRFNDAGGYFNRMTLGLGLEIETGGHVFQVNITNATGIYSTDYIPNTNANWAKGQFRLGFTISRLFRF